MTHIQTHGHGDYMTNPAQRTESVKILSMEDGDEAAAAAYYTAHIKATGALLGARSVHSGLGPQQIQKKNSK